MAGLHLLETTLTTITFVNTVVRFKSGVVVGVRVGTFKPSVGLIINARQQHIVQDLK